MRALPQQIIRRTPQQDAARTIRERFTLLRMGGQARSNSRGRSKAAGGLWRCWMKSDMASSWRKKMGPGTLTGETAGAGPGPVWRRN